MFNFIKMDIRRLFRSLSFYIVIGIFMFITCMNVYSNYNTLKNRDENEINQAAEEDTDDDSINGGLYVTDSLSQAKEVTFATILEDLYSGNNLIFFVALIMTIFIC